MAGDGAEGASFAVRVGGFMSAEHNLVWAKAFVAELLGAQVAHAVICPGSRSTPLTLALLREKRLQSHVILDERVAGFFALGLSKATRCPVALVCTSGSAGTHFFPAIVEAFFSHVPLFVITADRPWELHGFGAPQTMPQLGLYGRFVCLSENIPAPADNKAALLHMRAVLAKALAQATHKALPAHMNFEFREPLCSTLTHNEWPVLPPVPSFVHAEPSLPLPALENVRLALNAALRPLIVVGNSPPNLPFASAVFKLSEKLYAPLLAETASNLRLKAPPHALLIASYDILLRDAFFREQMQPDCVLCLGGTLVSKQLQTWLGALGARIFMFAEHGAEADFQHVSEAVIQCNMAKACTHLAQHVASEVSAERRAYAERFLRIEKRAQQSLSVLLEHAFCEPAIVRRLMASLPSGSHCLIASSMPIRDADAFAAPSSKEIHVHVNRGLNGIDCLISTAQGIAVATQRPTYVLIGDLAFLHDIGGWMRAKRLEVPLGVVLINNGGGGIFHFLPVAQQKEEFEEAFVLPHDTPFSKVAELVGANYFNPKTLSEFSLALSEAGEQKLSLIEVCTCRHSNVEVHQALYEAVSKSLKEFF